MKEKEIKLLKDQLDKLSKIPKNQFGYSPSGVKGWISGTVSKIEGIFGGESLKIDEFRRIEDMESLNLEGDQFYDIDDLHQIAEPILQSCIEELKSLGSPTTIYDGKSKGINLTMIQNQSNIQTVDINIIFNALNDELTGPQLKEIQSILDSKEKKEDKKKKLLSKLKDFGIDTISSIVAGILMNMIQGNK